MFAHRPLLLVVAATVELAAASAGARAASIYDDDFSTGSPTPNWSAFADDANALRLSEESGRLWRATDGLYVIFGTGAAACRPRSDICTWITSPS